MDDGNRADFSEFVAVRCLHHISGGVMSFETYTEHRLAGCHPVSVADNSEDFKNRRRHAAAHNPLDFDPFDGLKTPRAEPESGLEARGESGRDSGTGETL